MSLCLSEVLDTPSTKDPYRKDDLDNASQAYESKTTRAEHKFFSMNQSCFLEFQKKNLVKNKKMKKKVSPFSPGHNANHIPHHFTR